MTRRKAAPPVHSVVHSVVHNVAQVQPENPYLRNALGIVSTGSIAPLTSIPLPPPIYKTALVLVCYFYYLFILNLFAYIYKDEFSDEERDLQKNERERAEEQKRNQKIMKKKLKSDKEIAKQERNLKKVEKQVNSSFFFYI